MRSSHTYFVYILRCADGSYYIGMSGYLDRRLEEHHSGFYPTCYTFTRRPVELKYTEAYQFVDDAIAREKQLKRWSRAKKEALINGKMGDLKQLARNSKNDYTENPD